MEDRLRGDIFAGLKQALKARRMTYGDLAGRMGLSEPTIKRIFADCDCKMARLLSICDLLGVSLGDLVDRARRIDAAPMDLPAHVEAELAADPRLFYLFILFRDGLSEAELAARYDLSPDRMFTCLRRLERLGLATTGPDGHIRVTSDLPVRFRRHGPLHRLIRDINTQFLGTIFDAQDRAGSSFRTLSRRMLPDTARAVQKDLAAFCDRLNTMARQDQLVGAPDELKTYKFAAALGPVHFPDMIRFDEAPR